MIIPEDKPSTRAIDDDDTVTLASANDHEVPPPYAGIQDGNPVPAAEPRSSVGEGTSAEAPIRSTSRPAPQIPASNFVVIKRTNDGITGSYVIDTQLRVPKSVAFWSPEGSEPNNDDGLISGERPHLYLESTHGSVHADIWLVRGRGSAEPEQEVKAIADDRALINVKTGHSVINTRLVSSS